MSDNDSPSVRVNVRIPKAQHELMREFGEILGLPDTDGACVKHFIAMGIQACAGGISSIKAVRNSTETLDQLKMLNALNLAQVESAKQLDLVEEAGK